jgi:transcription elongation factor GreA
MIADNEKFYLTKEGLEEIKKEYSALLKIRTAKTQSEAPNVLESQDLNPEYLSFKEDLELLETRLTELENVIKNAVIIEKPPKEREEYVDLGAQVQVEAGGQKGQFTIVGTIEANPDLGKISNESPVGRALLGHKTGDQVTITSPIKTIYKIKEIKYS